MSQIAGRRRRIALRLSFSTCLAAVAAALVFGSPAAVPEGDQPRYATLGLNLADHGVFSSAAYAPDVAPAPSLAWAGPLIAGEVALAAALDRGTKSALTCIATGASACHTYLPALRLLHLGEILIFLACLWWIGYLILHSELRAWLVTAVGLGFREVLEFANMVMTEPLYLMAYGLFAASLVTAFVGRKGPAWWALTGLLLGFVVLVKPSTLVLLPALVVLILLMAAWRGQPMRAASLSALCLASAASVVVASWLARSAILFDSLALTDPVYLEASLSHRFAYDRMSWTEWLGGWLYYLPDFGDAAAAALFGDGTLDRLGFGPDGYYVYGVTVLHPAAHAVTAPAVATGYLIKTYVLGEPLKFAAVTALLTWRGLFVGRYLGLAGIAAFAGAVYLMPQRQRDPLVLLAILGFAVAIVHGALSVSIPRYNLALIPVYAVSLVWCLEHLWSRLRAGRQHKRK